MIVYFIKTFLVSEGGCFDERVTFDRTSLTNLGFKVRLCGYIVRDQVIGIKMEKEGFQKRDFLLLPIRVTIPIGGSLISSHCLSLSTSCKRKGSYL